MSRLLVKAGKALGLGLALTCATLAPAYALEPPPDLWFAGTRLILERPQWKAGEIAVASDDAGLSRILAKAGATLAYDPRTKSVTIVAADKRTIVFTLDDPHYLVDGLAQTAAFAPYASGKLVYLPLAAVARALYVDPLPDMGETILQPQLAWLDARSDGHVTVVTLRGGTALHFKRLADAGDGSLSIAFLGVASTLDRNRQVGVAALRTIGISVSGTPRNPTTVVTFGAVPGATIALVPSASPNEIALAFGLPGTALGGTPVPALGDATSAIVPLSVRDPRIPVATPLPAVRDVSRTAPDLPGGDPYAAALPSSGPSPAPAGSAQPGAALQPPAQITALDVEAFGQGFNVRVVIDGNLAYEWHRLPDNRWYVDLENAQLAVPTQDQPFRSTSLLSLRVRQMVAVPIPVVRIALSLTSPRQVDVVPFDGGLTFAVNPVDDTSGVRAGAGQFGAPDPALPSAAPAPPDPTPSPPGTLWKFAPPLNPKLIVIDPGHGGSDSGAMHNGLVEKDLTLDISQRLRVLLLARGWQVKMTRDDDSDVYAPNDSARDELQARDDVANNAGARIFVCVHINSFTSSSLSGTTTYYYKDTDLPLAQAIHARLIAALGTKDDGVRKENFYVLHHSRMPATLIETAFLSNPDDAALLRSPAFLQKVADSIAAGIGDYASNSAPPATDGT
jgi:N-acetylmuramoyl-L-alanine amidase CwlD